jgi:hypothetical protein
MPDIMLILSCLSQSVDKTSLGRLGCVVEGLLAMTGRVTMRGLSRWTERGGKRSDAAAVVQHHAQLGPSALAGDSPAPAGR